jgi:thiamine pyrophosphokinase
MGNHERVALVFAGGDPPDPADLVEVPRPDLVIAADSGLHHAVALGIPVDLVVGDLDSADPAMVEAAVAAGAIVERHAVDKDATDLELALLAARQRGCGRVVVLGGYGGRVDHLLAGALLLASPQLAPLRIEARLGASTVHVVRDEVEVRGAPGDVLTLLAVGGAADGVSTEGLRYPLRNETLTAGSTRGVSNQLVSDRARVSLRAGVLLLILPRWGAGS